jgi:MraZ protein
VLYTFEEWEKQNEVIRGQINTFNKEHNRFLRGFYRGTAEVILDGSNRLLLPKRLLDEAGIDKDIVLSGQDAKLKYGPKTAITAWRKMRKILQRWLRKL